MTTVVGQSWCSNETIPAELLRRTADLAIDYLATVGERSVGGAEDIALPETLPPTGDDPLQVIETMARTLDPGLVASQGPRYFGFVIGGSLPAALAAEWLTSAWDQNACLRIMSPAAARAEAVAAAWLLDLLGLPAGTSVGFTTGATMANFTALAAARHAVLARAGWDVEERGLAGAPPITLVAGEEAHASVLAAVQMLGLGRAAVVRVAADDQGRMRPDDLRERLAPVEGPLVVCAQAGNVNTGACDPFDAIAPLVHERGGWLHVDGAFGLWAAAAPALAHLVRGVAAADSWATDAHKWLNVGYDSGLALVRDPAAHRAAMTFGAPYLPAAADGRDGSSWVPESSRRARGFAVYAALRSLGRRGVAELVGTSARLARRMADRLRQDPAVTVLNDVVLNQVLVRFMPPAGGDADAYTRAVIAAVQADGTCWAGGTRWQGQEAMRISISNWSTSDTDVDRSADAILRCARNVADHSRRTER